MQEEDPKLPALIEAEGEVALSDELVRQGRAYIAGARAEGTRLEYARAWGRFETWCRDNGRQALPASPETVAAWLTWLGSGRGRGKPLAPSTINLWLSAVIVAQRTAGYSFDRKHPLIGDLLRGIYNEAARRRAVRKARPILGVDLRQMLDALPVDRPKAARDAALLALGWAAALRRSELVGLDWCQHGGGQGFATVDDRGVVVKLLTSKSSQDEAVEIVTPRADMPTASRALEAWAAMARLSPGEPIFRPVTKGDLIRPQRLTAHAVAVLVKEHVGKLAATRGSGPEEIALMMEAFSGHSMRSGYATTAAMHGEDDLRIKDRMRHASMDTTSGYIRAGEQWSKSGLGRFGF